MKITIQPMTEDDYPDVTSLWEQSEGLGALETPHALTTYLQRNPGCSHVAVHEDRIVAAAMSGHDGRRGYLYHVAVAEDVRGNGVGRQLIDACLQSLGDQGISRCSIHIYQENESAVQFWERLGWRERDDLRVMAIDLDNSRTTADG